MGCDFFGHDDDNWHIISIHAPIVGCDIRILDYCLSPKISIHAPIVGCDHFRRQQPFTYARFQSTHPSWGATYQSVVILYRVFDFNPRTHRGVRLGTLIGVMTPVLFQSTHPSWGATGYDDWVARLQRISIHAPIVGCDANATPAIILQIYFNPRTHRGVRRIEFVCTNAQQ